jgi:predicted TIM-barrel fold metal-dependent hydrolase
MQPEDLIIVSVDDHVVEPPDVFERHLPPKYHDIAPHVVHMQDGSDQWSFCGINIPNVGLNAVAGRPKEEYGREPTSFDELRPGCFDVHERIKDMSAGGVLASLNFPSMVAFAGRLFAQLDDKDAALALLRAYNDWHIEDWCGSYPGRFIPLSITPLWDPQLAAVEIHRVAAKGCHAVSFVENPVPLGLPSLHSDHWDPFWQACADDAVTVCMHIGSSSKLPSTAPDAPIDVAITLTPLNSLQAAADIIHSPIFKKFPDLKVSLSEGGIGWVPYFLERLDHCYRTHHAWTGADFGDRLPSEVFLDHVLLCYITDGVGVKLARDLGIGNITVEVDYPHSDSSWPHSPEALWKDFEGSDLTEDEIHRVTHRNAMEWFHFDPFAVRPTGQSTAAALRAEVHGHDVSIRSRGKSNRSALRMGDLQKAAAGASLNAVPS